MRLQLEIPQLAHLGTDLRTLRKHRGLTLQSLADTLGRSVGWLSQVERGISEPEIQDIKTLADVLDVPETLLSPDGPTYIVRGNNRRALPLRVEGLAEALLSPDLTDDFEVVHSTFAPGTVRNDPVTRQTQELAFLISGKLDLWIGDNAFTLEPGDSARMRGEPFRWANPYQQEAVAVWVISPPIY